MGSSRKRLGGASSFPPEGLLKFGRGIAAKNEVTRYLERVSGGPEDRAPEIGLGHLAVNRSLCGPARVGALGRYFSSEPSTRGPLAVLGG